MLRKLASIVFLLTGLVIGLGAFGHDSNAANLAAEFAKFPAFDAQGAKVTIAVWHFCSGAMLTLGAICVWTWWRSRRGVENVFFPTDVIGVLYLIAGAASVYYTGMAFFWVFFALGTVLLICSIPLRRPVSM